MLLPILIYINLFSELADLITLIIIIILMFVLLLESIVIIAIPCGGSVLLCTLEDEGDRQMENVIITGIISLNHMKN